MLNIQFASAYVSLSVDRKRYDADMMKIQRDLAKFPGTVTVNFVANTTKFWSQIHGLQAELRKFRTFTITLYVNRMRAVADINLVRQQLNALNRRSAGTVAIRANLRPWRAAMRTVAVDLLRIRQFAQIPIGVAGFPAAHSNLNLLMQHLRAMQALGKTKVNVGGRVGAGAGGIGGSSRGGGPGFLSGLGMGLGLPYAANPAMMAGQATGASISGSVGTAASIQSQIAELRRVSGMNAGQAAGFKQSLFNMGTSQAGVSIDDLMEISQVGGRAGVADREGPGGLLKFTKDLAMVKNAVADMPTEELASSMIKVLNVFELGTDRVASFGSALTAMDNVSVASARDILNITSRLSGTAQAIGMTLPQVTAFASVLKDVGLSNEVAGTSFSQIFRKMATDSHGFAQQIGVDAEEFANAYRRDPMEALGMVINKFKDLNDTIEGQEFLSDLGLKGARVTASLQQLASKFDLVGERAKIASSETGNLSALMNANALKSDTLEASYQKLKNALVGLADAMGQPLLEPATGLTNALTGITKSLLTGEGQILQKNFQLMFGGMDAAGKNQTRQEMEDWIMRNVLGKEPGAAAIAPGNPLAAKRPGFVGPPAPARDPFAGENLMFNAGNRLMGVLGAISGVKGSLVGAGMRGLAGVLPETEKKNRRRLSSDISGVEMDRVFQDAALNMSKDKDDEVAKNTRTANTLLSEVRDILKQAGRGVQAAVLGQ